MPQHVFLTANITIERSAIHVAVTDVEDRQGPIPTSYREIRGCQPNVLAAIACRRDGYYPGVRFRPGVGSADFPRNPASSLLWSEWPRMLKFFRENYGDPSEYGMGFIGPVRTGGAGDTQWRVDTASGVAATGDLISEAVREFIELGIAEPMLDEAGKSVGLKGYGRPRFAGDLKPYQSVIDETLLEEWGAFSPELTPTFDYCVRPVQTHLCDHLVGCDLPLVITANRHAKSVGALEFVLTLQREFDDKRVAVVDLEATRKDGVINGFLNREVKLICRRKDHTAMVFGLNPFGGISEHGFHLPLNGSTAKYVLNTKSRAAIEAAGIWPM